ncbi:cation-dependent mannose-6-phosphate receptor-like isoform X2 [Amphiura filiformis]|uniref:cation-dependent mannose-6-phosphate receptor-like isoform X2 n=2 Tax=Amphiura filiformis TaxID=82378 RepID=UPI003B2122E1
MLYKLQEMEFTLLFLCILRFMHGVLGECTVDSDKEKQYRTLLEPLHGKTVKDVKLTENDEWTYTIKFCEPIEGMVGVMQNGNWDNNTDDTHAIGKIDSAHIKVGTNWIMLTYKNGETYGSHCGKEPRQAHIMLLCSSKLIGSKAIIEENNEKEQDCSYLFEIESSVACTNGSSSGSSGDRPLSFGSIFCIILLTVIVAYIFFGFVYNRFILGAKGLEQFPNVAFWRDLGNLEADGCDFIFRSKLIQEPRSYKGLGDDQLGLDEDEERDDHLLPMY